MALVALYAAQKFAVPLSEVTVLLLALFQTATSIGEVTRNKNALDNFFPSFEQIERLRSMAKEMKQPSGQKIFDAFNKEIVVKDLTFAYPGHPAIVKISVSSSPKGK